MPGLLGKDLYCTKGYTRFTEKREVEELLNGVNIKEMELLTRTMENQTEEIKEWLIVAEKESE